MKIRTRTIFSKIMYPVLSVLIGQGALIFLLFFTIARPHLNNQLISTFQNSLNIRKNHLENSMSVRWGDLNNQYSIFSSSLNKYLSSHNLTIDELLSNKDESNYILEEYVANLLPNVLYNNHVNYSYFIMETTYEEDNKASIILSSSNPDKVNNNLIDVVTAPYPIINYYLTNSYGISNQTYTFTFKDIKNKEFYEKPMKIVRDMASPTKINGYWSSTLTLSNHNIMTYTLPVIYQNKVIGAFGVGLTEKYLENYFRKLNGSNDFNVEIVVRKNGHYQSVFRSFDNLEIPDIAITKTKLTQYYEIAKITVNNVEYYICGEILNLVIEQQNGEEWRILGILRKNEIFSISHELSGVLTLALVSGLILSIVTLFIIINKIQKPIVKVTNNINNSNFVDLQKTNVYEVDTLLDKLQNTYLESLHISEKFKMLLSDTRNSIALAEYDKKSKVVSITTNFFPMLDIENVELVIDLSTFIDLIFHNNQIIVVNKHNFNKSYEQILFENNNEFILKTKDKYFSLKSEIIGEYVYGTLYDTTSEYLEKKKLERERDNDLLTGLLNRRGIYNLIDRKFSKLQAGAAIVIDIDNLKKINDELGHNAGDEYIKLVATYFKNMQKKFEHLHIGHVSGDEFLFFITKIESDDYVTRIIEDLNNVKSLSLEYGRSTHFVSLSCGIAYYEKGITQEELIKRADFAMYKVKQNGKNGVGFFDSEFYKLYNEESKMEDLIYELINTKAIKYAYQPIVDLTTGEIFGYEALMRPQIEELRSPVDVLKYAKRYSLLGEIEKITLFEATNTFSKAKIDKRLFINSISSQFLSQNIYDEFIDQFKDLLSNIIFEIIEEDYGDKELITKKTNYFKSLNMNYAIDDYGTGFNNINMILEHSPLLIKIDGSLIKDIDTNKKKQQLTKSIIHFCKENNMYVVAESIETIEELKLVKKYGADYGQGYFIGKPSLDIVDIKENIKEQIKKA